ncbi:hypothetical protein C2S51_001759 [Perilla frutescens var. frutescens]|nr:hypothetical protein C2S51_001759 [Perilla frutescens var. frutescens]
MAVNTRLKELQEAQRKLDRTWQVESLKRDAGESRSAGRLYACQCLRVAWAFGGLRIWLQLLVGSSGGGSELGSLCVHGI